MPQNPFGDGFGCRCKLRNRSRTFSSLKGSKIIGAGYAEYRLPPE
jgi:hypothetical protein